MEQVIRSVFCVGVLAFGGTVFACNYPGDPDFLVPNGAQASKDEMISTQGKVKSFVTGIEGYLKCLDDNLAATGEETTEEQRAIYTLRYNAAVDAMELVANDFNVALRAYKAAQ